MVRRAPALERSSSADVYRSALTRPERKNYIDAVKCLSKKPALTPASVSAGARSRFDDFVVTHVIQTYWVHGTVSSSMFFCKQPDS